MKLLIAALFFLGFIFASAEEKPSSSGNRIGEPVVKWTKHTQKLTGYKSDAEQAERDLQALIQKKNAGQKYVVEENGTKTDILEAIVAAHESLTEAVANYEKEKKEIKYRYPGEGDWVERNYLPIRRKNLEQVEREVGLDGQLTNIKRQIDDKYAELRKQARQKKAPQNDSPDKKNYTPKDGTLPEDEPKKLKLVK